MPKYLKNICSIVAHARKLRSCTIISTHSHRLAWTKHSLEVISVQLNPGLLDSLHRNCFQLHCLWKVQRKRILCSIKRHDEEILSPLLLKMNSFLIRYISTIASSPSTFPRSSSPPLPSIYILFLSLINKETDFIMTTTKLKYNLIKQKLLYVQQGNSTGRKVSKQMLQE